MKIDFSLQYSRLKHILENLSGKTIIITHYDLDGLTSAIIFSRILERYGKEYNQDFFIKTVKDSYRSKYMKKDTIKKYLKTFDNLFMLDYCFDTYFYLSDKNIFVFDHHKSGEQNKEYIINPAWAVSPEELPSCSALVYDFYYYLFGENKLLKQIAFIGAAADYMIYASLPYLHTNTSDKDLFLSNSVMPKPVVFQIMQNLQAIYEKNETDSQLFEHLLKNTKTDLSGFFCLSKQHQNLILNTTKKELLYIKDVLDAKKVDAKTKIVYLELPEEYKEIRKFVLNVFELMYPEYTKILFIKRNKLFSCSLRSPKINLSRLIKNLKIKIPGLVGGGHEFAAGCAGPIDKLDLVLETIRKNIVDKKS